MVNKKQHIEYYLAIEVCTPDYSDTIVTISLGFYDKLTQVEKLRKKITECNPDLKFKLLITDVSRENL